MHLEPRIGTAARYLKAMRISRHWPKLAEMMNLRH